MKQLKTSLYKAIASIVVSDNIEFKTSRNITLFSQILSTYPSKSIYALVAHRVISFFDRNVLKIDLILEFMKEEGEDEEITKTISDLRKNPSITTSAEVTELCIMFSDYIKYSRILKKKDSFLQSLDLVDEDVAPNKENMRQLYNLASDIVEAYNYANITETSHTFDTSDKEAMKYVVAETKDARSSDKVIVTGVRGLNMILSPGYLGGYLYVYAALPGCYKSGILLKGHVDTLKYNEHIKKITNGKTPISIYISMENTMTQTVRRLWSLLFPTADMSMFTVDEITDMIEHELTANNMRSLILYYGYREKSTRDLTNIIQGYNTDKTEVVAVFLDYIKRIRSARDDNTVLSSEKAELHAIMNELKLIAANFNIPIVTGHQLNRAAAAAVDEIAKNGGYNKTDAALGRANISVAWEIMEVADFLALMNIENHGDNKVLVVKAAKQRDKEGEDSNIIGFRQPFVAPTSFALRDDIMENVPICEFIYDGKQRTNYIAENI